MYDQEKQLEDNPPKREESTGLSSEELPFEPGRHSPNAAEGETKPYEESLPDEQIKEKTGQTSHNQAG
jgi:hypothetical protein